MCWRGGSLGGDPVRSFCFQERLVPLLYQGIVIKGEFLIQSLGCLSVGALLFFHQEITKQGDIYLDKWRNQKFLASRVIFLSECWSIPLQDGVCGISFTLSQHDQEDQRNTTHCLQQMLFPLLLFPPLKFILLQLLHSAFQNVPPQHGFWLIILKDSK